MARVRSSPKWLISGVSEAGYYVYTYEPGTSTPKDTYTDTSETVANTNPIILDARGEADIWWVNSYKVAVYTGDKDVDGVLVWSVDNYGDGENQIVTGNYNTVKNGSFETDAANNGEPDDWTVVDYSTGVHSLDSTDQYHGLRSLKFTSIGAGGGYATTGFFEVQELKDLTFQYSLRSTVADVRNVVDVLWYTSIQTNISTTNIYDDSATNPTAWTQFQNTVTPPSTARYGKLRIYGCHSSDATSGSTWFDAISAVELYGTMASQDKDTVDITGGTATGLTQLQTTDFAMLPPITAGTGTAYTANVGQTIDYVSHKVYYVRAHADNTGSATINLDGLGAKTIRTRHGSTLTAGQIQLDQILCLHYDNTYMVLQNESIVTDDNITANTVSGLKVTDDTLTFPKLNNRITVSNSYLISTVESAIVTVAIDGWTDVTVSALSMPELYIDSDATTLYVRILYHCGTASTQSVDSRVTVDSTVSSEVTTTALGTGVWKWSPFMSVNISAKSGWHNIDAYELRPATTISGGYDIAAVQQYLA